jgi:hypothetical protein
VSPLSAARLLVLGEVKERDYQQWIIDFAGAHGWRYYHTHYSKFSPSGFPDLFLVRGDRAVALEVKRMGGRATPDQDAWVADLNEAGVEASVVWPSDEEFVVGLLL